ncbi:Preimplantation_protein 3 [Hexamita inflata]|uniref:Preimplantation protein 3 n=1 Tax=Hexamita inflata TaxID=28002 RepID=A0AA86Q3P1_9EUKA|nr:Preimplantation protein 3 [Hexamita inflata]CAI9951376.1 Preimplantation protein 3 [Hexamita inflata]CAI9975026.1 Preimplantation protein 3 [Hexamita inflata]
MSIQNAGGLPDSHIYPNKLYNQSQTLKIEQIINQQMDARLVQAYIREYLDTLNPNQIDKYFELPVQQSAQIQKVVRYENLSLILQEMSHLLSHLSPECTKQSCPTMLATVEWKFLCTVHGQEPQDCCAVSYSSHFLDSGFPTFIKSCSQEFLQPNNRTLVAEAIKNYQFIERRSYRILAHGYFHHKQAFTVFEKQRYLYRRFIKYLNVYAPKQVASMVPFIPLEEFQ